MNKLSTQHLQHEMNAVLMKVSYAIVTGVSSGSKLLPLTFSAAFKSHERTSDDTVSSMTDHIRVPSLADASFSSANPNSRALASYT